MKKLLFIFALLFVSVSVFGNVVAQFTFLDSKNPSQNSKGELEIGEKYFQYSIDNIRTIYDFDSRKIYRLDLIKKTYDTDSLFSDIAFRDHESRNRLFLGDVFKKSGVTNASPNSTYQFLPVFIEHDLSINLDGVKKTKLKTERIGKNIIYVANGVPLLKMSEDSVTVSMEESIRFSQFIQNFIGGHPDILKKIAQGKKIPKRIVNLHSSILSGTKEISIAEVTQVPDRAFSLEKFRFRIDIKNEKEMSEILTRGHKSVDSFQKNNEALIKKAELMANGDQYLDSFLLFMLYSLKNGQGLPSSFSEHRSKFENNEDIAVVVSSLKPSGTQEGAEENLKNLKGIEDKTIGNQFVLWIWEANLYLELGKPFESEKLLQKALMVDPLMAGPLRDLGNLYMEQYNAPLAFKCWDLARQIAPNHSLLSSVNNLEDYLLKKYPEYF